MNCVFICVDTIDIGRSPLTPSDGFSRVANGDSGTATNSGATALHQAHAGGLAGAPPSGRAARWLDRALRVVDEGPRPFYRAAVVSLGVTSALAMGVAALIRPHDSLPATQWHVITGALAGLWLSALLGLASLVAPGRFRPTAWLNRTVAPRERAAIWLALAVWFPLLLVVVYYRARATIPPSVRYVYFPYDDKRWETAAYLLGVLAPVILLTTAARVLTIAARATIPPSVRYVYFPYDDKRWETAAYLLGVLAPVILLTTAARVLTIARGMPPTWRAWFTGLFSGSRR